LGICHKGANKKLRQVEEEWLMVDPLR
jgi:hypothetical protein